MKNYIAGFLIVAAGFGVGFYASRNSKNEPKFAGFTTLARTVSKVSVASSNATGWGGSSTYAGSASTTLVRPNSDRSQIAFVWPGDGRVYWVSPVATTVLQLSGGYRVATDTPLVVINSDPVPAGYWSGYTESTTGTLTIVEL